MSTNDTVLVLANGLAGNKNIRNLGLRANFGIFQAALNHVCLELAKMIVRDGEGVHRVVTVRVNGAKTVAGRRCRRARGGEQPAGENELARRRPELGPHH